MAIINSTQILQQFRDERIILTRIKSKYGLNRGQLEVLTHAYLLQTKHRPFFYLPDLRISVSNMGKGLMYEAVKFMVSISIINIETFKTRGRKLYSVSGTGLHVLKSYYQNIQRLYEPD